MCNVISSGARAGVCCSYPTAASDKRFFESVVVVVVVRILLRCNNGVLLTVSGGSSMSFVSDFIELSPTWDILSSLCCTYILF